ncbi:hypothetical protein GCE86_10020 [Micromonospora terminaliae]|uniref:Uncharacterized protein n=1 Tax=Micromonospora terminaliae TaxID=1914461 RepID=A0AAJ3DIK4_9ACTN|nr:hypothetical protein [Micromonospora terminaliae]NES27889.1 hypothetical protein [Micromonospora terminaliae]QGL47338.1 hypothetical protein GCE86_10020 [Micromonospora terminaliae]
MRDRGEWTAATAGATIEFLPGQGDDPASVENIDARIYRDDGVCHHATFMTPDEIARVLTRWVRADPGRDDRLPAGGEPDAV